MIVVLHNENRLVSLTVGGVKNCSFDSELLTHVIPKLVSQFPSDLLIWCHQSVVSNVDWENIANLFNHDRKFLSYLPDVNFFSDFIGYVDESIFIKVNKEVTFPTWQMSGYVGGISTSVLTQVDSSLWETENFDFAINSIAKVYQQKGLFCYSEPRLLRNKILTLTYPRATNVELFLFVAKNYKWVWKYILLFDLLIYEKKLMLLPWLFSLLKNQMKVDSFNLIFENNCKTVDFISETIDVIIPTIGRKMYLYDVLKDLSVQTHLPNNVIIVEQNPDEESVSELDYLHTESWPFSIQHIFTHQIGACQARNKALEKIKSEWCFFADDDIRFDKNLLYATIYSANKLQSEVLNLSCLRVNDIKTMKTITQWSAFGSGCSFVKSYIIKGLKFNSVYEFGFGEDTDFGMQIRNKGYDVIYLPEPDILHLKAPMGGFRTKPVLEWHNEKLAPKPSPTIMLFLIMHNTIQQLRGYKTVLFFKYYKLQSIRNPWVYYITFKKQWQVSMKWAQILLRRYEV